MGYGYPDGALERLQEEELGILKEVARVCVQLNLVWFMDSGSCLGALRHGGFIPWDDDIDVALPLADYRTFCAEAPALLSEGFGLYTHAETANYPPLWAKVYRKGTRFMSQQMADAGHLRGRVRLLAAGLAPAHGEEADEDGRPVAAPVVPAVLRPSQAA